MASEPETSVPTARITAGSRRQAMDWSLALISQGIASTVVQEIDGPSGGWGLNVTPEEYASAVETVRLYRLENRGWRWRKQVLRGGLVFDWSSLAWVAMVTFFFWLDSVEDLKAAGLMNSSAVATGQWWRLFTAMWLHADIAHLAANATFGVVLFGLVLGWYGTGVGLLASYMAGAAGNLFVWLVSQKTHLNLGASGMVMGALGMLAAQSFSIWHKYPSGRKMIVTGLASGFMLFILFGLSPGTDILAHLGGFCAGIILGIAWTAISRVAAKPSLNFLCGFLFTALVILPWWLALRSSR